jgi:hypothetical protein
MNKNNFTSHNKKNKNKFTCVFQSMTKQAQTNNIIHLRIIQLQ